MKKIFISLLIVPIIILLFIFFPRSVNQAVVISHDSDYTYFYVGNSIKKFKPSTNLQSYSVVNFKYNIIRAHDFKVQSPIPDRIMIKSDGVYDLEATGSMQLAKKVFYYKINEDSTISPCSSDNLLVGKTNSKIYSNISGKLSTFVIFPPDYTTTRVGISTTNFTSLYHNKVQIKCNTPSKLYSVKEHLYMDIPAGEIITMTPVGRTLTISSNTVKRVFSSRVYLRSDTMFLQSIQRGFTPFTPSYSGVLEFLCYENGISIINELPVESYLLKVVPSEMPDWGGLESLKCQAICARTYAISDMIKSRFANLGFYVDDSTQSQVYNNMPPTALSIESVNSTKGFIMSYNNEPLDAVYYSTSCGIGAAYKDIWFDADYKSENKPYLKVTSYLDPKIKLPNSEDDWLNFYKSTNIPGLDANSPYFRWNISFSKTEFTKMLTKSIPLLLAKNKDYVKINQAGTDLSNLPDLKGFKGIKILKRGPGGNVMELTFIFEDSSITVKGDLNIRSAIRCSKAFTGNTLILERHNGDSLTNVNLLPSSFFSIENYSDRIIIYGGGYGHGVGMSQYGAMQLSIKEFNYKDILNTYYKGYKLDKLY